MISLDSLTPGARVEGLSKSGYVTLKGIEKIGDGAVNVFYVDQNGALGSQLLYRADESRLSLVEESILPPLDADANEFKLAAEAYRIRLAYLYDPLLAVNTSAVEPLPHQISAVYEHMLDRQPLRYLLADDPGAGKTIMAGLLIKELILRGDVERCLVIVPGNLTEQWQDELHEKFQLVFEIMTNDKLNAAATGNWLNEHDLVIARLDKLSRDELLRPKLLDTRWDLVIFDEAHKLSASRFGREIKRTQRFKLAEAIAPLTRHLLLMTATPHNGKEDDFQLFLSLLDQDRFEGRRRDDTAGPEYRDLMRRLTKEHLVRFDNTPLFPERRAYTVNYELSAAEAELYEEVTRYVREEFNRADRLDEQRRGTIGFALTVLQRRLASSPAAIHTSLERRRRRLEEQLQDHELLQRLGGPGPENNRNSGGNREYPWQWFTEDDLEDLEDAPDDEVIDAEEQAMLRATTAATIEELTEEIKTLRRLEALAQAVLRSREDRKWTELSHLIQDNDHMFDRSGARRKLVIFTEHKDTLKYLEERISRLVGNGDAIVTISGGMAREHRKIAEARFKQDQDVQILIATDAAGEGINLQRAHLMINYDLPWNPNRLEQRFGRIHRIGQTEVCHLWNLVAHETREGQVFQRLLSKLEVESEALSGRVFDILGTVFEGTALRDLLIEAIRSDGTGTATGTLTKLDVTMDHQRLHELLETRALALDTLSSSTVQRIRDQMERARLQRLQPFYIEAFFQEAFGHLGGTMRLRERRRWQIRHIPVELRRRDRVIGMGAPLLPSYERITFHHDHVEGTQGQTADLVAPGHPLLDTVVDLILERYRGTLRRGAILVDRTEDAGETVRALAVLEHEILEGFLDDGRPRRVVSRRLLTVWIDPDGSVENAGSVPWMDLDVPGESELDRAGAAVAEAWGDVDLESQAVAYVAERIAPEHFAEVDARRMEQIEKTRREVTSRLTTEIAHWDRRAEELRLEEEAGKVRRNINSENARRRSEELHARLAERLRDLYNQGMLSSQIPVLRSIAMVVPATLLRAQEEPDGDDDTAEEIPEFSSDPVARKRIEMIAMNAVSAAERALGNVPIDVSAENRGYDIESRTPDGTLRFIEVKGRVAGVSAITVTHNEMKYGFNNPDNYYLAVVLVGEDDSVDGPHYVRNPFDKEPMWIAATSQVPLTRILGPRTTRANS